MVASNLQAKIRTKRKMKMWVLAETRGMKVLTTSMIKNLEIREEEVEDLDKVKEEEDSMVLIFIAMKNITMSSNALNTKEG